MVRPPGGPAGDSDRLLRGDGRGHRERRPADRGSGAPPALLAHAVAVRALADPHVQAVVADLLRVMGTAPLRRLRGAVDARCAGGAGNPAGSCAQVASRRRAGPADRRCGRPAWVLRRGLHRCAPLGYQSPDLGRQPVAGCIVRGVRRVDRSGNTDPISAPRGPATLARLALYLRSQRIDNRTAPDRRVPGLTGVGGTRLGEWLGSAAPGGCDRGRDRPAAPTALSVDRLRRDVRARNGEQRALGTPRGLLAPAYDPDGVGGDPTPSRGGHVRAGRRSRSYAQTIANLCLSVFGCVIWSCVSPEASRVRGGGP